MPKTALSIAASIVLLAIFASPAAADPVPSFTVNPNPPSSGVSASYTSTSTSEGQQITKVEWDFDNNGTFDGTGTTVTHTYPNAGVKTIAMQVTDDAATPVVVKATKQLIVVTRPPTAAFVFNPSEPFVGDDVLFASNSSDPDGDALDYLWNFGDGVTSPLRNPTHAFDTPGAKSVTLKVTDPYNTSDTTQKQVVIAARLVEEPKNNPPIANFAFGPRDPEVGQQVEFSSSAVDPERNLASQAWDLDGDGQFDDAHGDAVLYTYLTAGVRQVRLRVEDAGGLVAIHQRAVPVHKAPTPPPGYLRPDPKVHLKGLILSAGTRIQVLGVLGPRGALVTVRCRGKSCPAKQRRKHIKKRSVRFHSFERFLRAGVRLEIFVTKPGKIGSYTRYTVRRGRGMQPVYRCVFGTKLRPVRCR